MRHKKIAVLIMSACLMIPTTAAFATDTSGVANSTTSVGSFGDVVKGAFTGENIQKIKDVAQNVGIENASTTSRTPAMGQ